MSKSDANIPQNSNSGLSRRDLFRTAGLATGGALLLGLPKFLGGWVGEADAAVLAERGAPVAAVALELDGQFSGYLQSVSGGNAFAEVVTVPTGTQILEKHIGAVKFEDLVIETSFGSDSKLLATWVNETLSGKALAKNGAIIYVDLNFNERKRLEFVGAVISEAVMPEADAAGIRGAATMTIRLTPQSTRLAGGQGKLTAASRAFSNIKGKTLMSNSFRFSVHGLEMACRQIRSVQGIGFRRLHVPSQGEQRIPQQTLGPIDFSMVSIQLPEADAAPFYQWFDDLVLKGRPDAERGGLLEWLDLTMRGVVASVQLGGLGIVRYAPQPMKDEAPAGVSQLSASRLPLVQVDMYYETMNVIL